MTDQPDLQPLDDRAARAADDLRSRAEGRPRPAFDAEQAEALPPPPTSAGSSLLGPRRLLGAAAVVALLVGGLAWWQTRPESTIDHAGTTTVGPPRPHWIPDPPFGLEFVEASNTTGETSVAPEVFGPDRDDLRLAIGPIDPTILDLLGRNELATRVPVGRFDGFTVEFLPRLLFIETPEAGAVVAAQDLPQADLTTIAAGLSISSGVVEVDPSSLPPGWASHGRISNATAMTVGRGTSGQAVSSYLASVDMQPDGSATPSYAQVRVGSGDDLLVHAGAVSAAESERVAVRGREASLNRFDFYSVTEAGVGKTYDLYVVTWVERPGEVISLHASGLTRDQALELAELVEPLSTTQWEEMLEDEHDPAPGIESVLVGTGTFDDGARWTLRADLVSAADIEHPAVESGPRPRLAVALPDAAFQETAGYTDASHNHQLVQASTNPESSLTVDRWFVAGLVSDEVDQVHLVIGDRSSIIEAEIVEGAGHRGWVAELNPTGDETRATVFVSEGGSTSHMEISW